MPAFLQNKHTISLYFIIKGGLRQYTYIIFLKANKTGKGKKYLPVSWCVKFASLFLWFSYKILIEWFLIHPTDGESTTEWLFWGKLNENAGVHTHQQTGAVWGRRYRDGELFLIRVSGLKGKMRVSVRFTIHTCGRTVAEGIHPAQQRWLYAGWVEGGMYLSDRTEGVLRGRGNQDNPVSLDG